MTKSQRIREYFSKNPDAKVVDVAKKFEAAVPMVYKLRSQVRQGDWNPPGGFKPPALLPVPLVEAITAEDLNLQAITMEPNDADKALDARAKQGRKFDSGKLDYTLVPFKGLEEVVKVLMFGAQKYDRHNWRHVPDAEQRYSAAALRHMVAHVAGETTDHETGLSHLAHAGCCILFLLALERADVPRP